VINDQLAKSILFQIACQRDLMCVHVWSQLKIMFTFHFALPSGLKRFLGLDMFSSGLAAARVFIGVTKLDKLHLPVQVV
jgi:hypothetical protein